MDGVRVAFVEMVGGVGRSLNGEGREVGDG